LQVKQWNADYTDRADLKQIKIHENQLYLCHQQSIHNTLKIV